MKKSLQTLVLTVILSFFGACTCLQGQQADAEKFTVNKVYGDCMVLQRQKPVQIVGTAEADKSVKVTIGKNSVLAAAGKDGVWKAVLPAMEAGGPYTVTVSGAKNSKDIVFKDVLVGEVWFCSGQSNMQMAVIGGSKNGKQEAAAANFPQIRIFQVDRIASPGMEKNEISSKTGWEICSPKSIGKFSACGFYFGRELYKDLNIPIGLINSSMGGTKIEPWISKDGFESNNRTEELKVINDAYEDIYVKKIETNIQNWVRKFYSVYAKESAAAAKWQNPAWDVSSWQEFTLAVHSIKEPGVFWFRREVEIPAEWVGKDLTLELGVVDEFDVAFFNGTRIGSTTVSKRNYKKFNRNYKISGNLVKAGKNTIALRITNIQGDGGFTTDNIKLRLSENSAVSLKGKWLTKCEFIADVKKTGPCPTAAQQFYHFVQFPASRYNAMVKPWIVYPIRGIIWYQGCANVGKPRDYMTLHPLLIRDWRNKWNDHSIPFVFAQLAAFERHSPSNRLTDEYFKNLPPGESFYAALREVQAATLKIPLTGMGVAIDIGDHSDIHPQNKQEIAYRLAQEAKRLAYGYKGVTSGPMFKSMKIEGNKIRIEFSGIGSGLMQKGEKLNCFAIAAQKGKFVWANAKIDGNSVIVWSDAIKEPAKVRYAWAGYPFNPNLYNKEGFPAVPFRTDKPDYLLK